MSTKYSYSLNESEFHGEFDSIDEACAAAANELSLHGEPIWVAENVPPVPPEEMWDAADWLEHVTCQDDYRGEYAYDWDGSTAEQREELNAEVRKVLAAWLDRHNLRPTHWTVRDAEKFVVVRGPVGEVGFAKA